MKIRDHNKKENKANLPSQLKKQFKLLIHWKSMRKIIKQWILKKFLNFKKYFK